ncbi:MAG: YkgJ family cysteine cluster protein [Pseudomonadota bacterium]
MSAKPRYDCSNCPAFCCSYAEIALTEDDLDRIARSLSLTVEGVIQQMTKYGRFRGTSRYPMMLRHKPDPHFGTVCIFLDSDTRRCTIYEARPAACRGYPGGRTCGYYEFLRFERALQGDENHIAKTQ